MIKKFNVLHIAVQRLTEQTRLSTGKIDSNVSIAMNLLMETHIVISILITKNLMHDSRK